MARVSRVSADGPAFEAGIQVNDLIVAMDGRRLGSGDLDKRVERLEPGDRVKLTFLRRDMLRMIEVTPELALVAALTLPEVGHILRMNPRTIRRYIANGDLTAHNMGGKKTLRVKLVDLHEFWQRSSRVTDAR